VLIKVMSKNEVGVWVCILFFRAYF
jgi:hypothetical protein